MTSRRMLRVVLLAVLAAASVSCAYYNTFYLARKYYMRATDGQPYEVDREGSAQRSNYNKSADYSKKVLGVHPNSKWVDDAWLMWARTFIGADDPLKAVAMLEEFQTRFPNSDLKPDAEFFLGLAYRVARRHETSVDRFNNFLAQAPKHELVPYAYYERSKALMSLRRYKEAGESAGQILERYSKHRLAERALRQRAEARYQQRDWKGARQDFATMGSLALNDDERLRFLLREVDCLESARELDAAREVLRDARSHASTPPPVPAAMRAGPTATGSAAQPILRPMTLTPGQDHYGKLTLRMGSVELLAGNETEAIRLYQTVIQDYPRTGLAAEAQFRIGFAYETGSEDFARARAEYVKVKEQGGTSQFSTQAQQRMENLDRLERFRTATGSDSLARQAEARFLVAEHFLFNLERPERALEEYQQIADSTSDSSTIARALTAQGWVLARKLDRPAAGDSLFWKVVREYPRTEAQLAARDYLEAHGQTVDESLIVAPEFASTPVFEATLTQAPGQAAKLGQSRVPGVISTSASVPGGASRLGTPADSVRLMMEMYDSLAARAKRDTTAAARAETDSLRRALMSSDTTGRAAMIAEFEASKSKSAAVAPQATSAGTAPGASGAAGTAGAAGAATGSAAGASPGASPSGTSGGKAAGPAAVGASGAAAGTAAGAGAASGTAGSATAGAAGAATATGAAGKASSPASDPAAGNAMVTAADTARADSAATRLSPSSTSTTSGAAAVAPAGAAAAKTVPAAKPAAPPKPVSTSMSLTSFAKKPKLTAAQKDSVKLAEAMQDSLKKAHSDSVKTAKAMAKAKKKAAADSAKAKK